MKVKLTRKAEHVGYIVIDIDSRTISLTCLPNIAGKNVSSDLRKAFGVHHTKGNRQFHSIDAVLGRLSDPMSFTFSKDRPNSKHLLNMRSLYVLLITMMNKWPNFEPTQELPEPSDMAERAAWCSERPYTYNEPQQPLPSSPSSAQALVATAPTGTTVASPSLLTIPAPAGVLTEFTDESRQSLWVSLLHASGGDIVEALGKCAKIAMQQIEVKKASALAAVEVKCANVKLESETTRSEDEHKERTERIADAKRKRQATMIDEQCKRTKLNELEIATAQARLEKVKNGAGTSRRTFNVLSPAELTRLFRVHLGTEFYTKCQFAGCNNNVCMTKVHVVALKGYSVGCSDDELKKHTKIVCKNHKNAFENTIGRPVLFDMKPARLHTWLHRVGVGSTVGVCMLCGAGDPISVHDFKLCHDTAVALGGSDNADNIVVGHEKCNERQGTATATEFKQASGAGAGAIVQPTASSASWLRPQPTKVIGDIIAAMRSHSKTSYATSLVDRVKRLVARKDKKQLTLKFTTNVSLSTDK